MSMSRDLADRLAVVERLQHGEEAAVLLDLPGEGVEVAGAGVAARAPTSRLGRARRRDGRVDVGRRRPAATCAERAAASRD